MGIIGLKTLQFMKGINEEKSLNMDEMIELQVNLTNENVHIIPTEKDSEIKLHLYGRAMQELQLNTETRDRSAIISVRRGFVPTFENLFLDIYLPEVFEKNLSIKISSGNLKIDTVSVKNFILNASSGKLEAGKLKAEMLFVKISSGNVTIGEIDAKVLEVKGSSSAINIDACTVHRAKVETSSGNITLRKSIGNADINSSSGRTQLSYSEFENRRVNIRTGSGAVNLELPGNAGFFIEAQTTSGRFHSDFSLPGVESEEKGEYEGQIGDSSNRVFIQTGSGNIKLLKKE